MCNNSTHVGDYSPQQCDEVKPPTSSNVSVAFPSFRHRHNFTFILFVLTYLLTPWCRVLPEQLTGLQLVKKFPAFYGTEGSLPHSQAYATCLSWASPIQSTFPHPTSWRSILILSTYLRLGLPSGLFPSGFPTKTLYAPLSSDLYLYLYKILNIMYVISTKAWYDNTEHEQTKTLCLQ